MDDPDQEPQKNWITIKVKIRIHDNMMWIRNTSCYSMIILQTMDDSDPDQEPQKKLDPNQSKIRIHVNVIGTRNIGCCSMVA